MPGGGCGGVRSASRCLTPPQDYARQDSEPGPPSRAAWEFACANSDRFSPPNEEAGRARRPFPLLRLTSTYTEPSCGGSRYGSSRTHGAPVSGPFACESSSCSARRVSLRERTLPGVFPWRKGAPSNEGSWRARSCSLLFLTVRAEHQVHRCGPHKPEELQSLRTEFGDAD